MKPISWIVRYITVFSLLFTCSLCLPYNNGMTVSRRFSYAGKYSIDINDLKINNRSQYTIPYPKYIYAYCIVSFGDLVMQTTMSAMDVFIEAPFCGFSVRSDSSNSISKLSVSYLAYADNKLYGNPFRYSNQLLNKNILKDPSTFRDIYINYNEFHYFYSNGNREINQTGVDLKAMVLLNGFKTKLVNSLTFSISLGAKLLDSTGSSKIVKVIIGSHSQIPTYVQPIAFTVFLHLSSNNGHKDYRSISIYSQCFSGSNDFQYSNLKHIMDSVNTFVGLTSLFVFSQNLISFQSSIIDKSTISVHSPNYLSVTFIIIYCKRCSFKTQYYSGVWWSNPDEPHGRCFETCPSCTDQIDDYFCSNSQTTKKECSQKIRMEQQQLKEECISNYYIFLYSWMIVALIGIMLLLLLRNWRRKYGKRQQVYRASNNSILQLNNQSSVVFKREQSTN